MKDKDGEYEDASGVYIGGIYYTNHQGKPLRTLKSASNAIGLYVVGTVFFFGLIMLSGVMNSWLPMLLLVPLGIVMAVMRK